MKVIKLFVKQTPTPVLEQVGRQGPDEGCATQDVGNNPFIPMEGSASSSISKVSNNKMSKNDLGLEVNWPPKNPADKALTEMTMNTHFAVQRVIKDPVALALIKSLIEQGAV